VLRSISGAAWELDNAGNSEDITYVDVEDSNADPVGGSGNVVDASNSLNRGNNTNWNFTGSPDFLTWTGNSSSLWSDSGNWDQGTVPGVGDTVVIPDVTPNPQPVLDLPSLTIKNLTIQTDATLDTGGNSLTITGTYQNEGTLYRRGSDYVSLTDIDSGTVIYQTSGGTIQNYGDPGTDYYELKIDGATFSLQGDLFILNDLEFSGNGALNLYSESLSVEGNVFGTGTLDGGTGTVYVLGSLTTSNYIATNGMTSISGDWGVTNFSNASGTVFFDGTGSLNGGTFWNLQINSGTRTLTGTLSIDNNLDIAAGGILEGNGQSITVSGNWSNLGTFTHGNSSVSFADPGKTSVISGNTTFNNFTCSTPGKVLQFTINDTQTILGSLTVQGSLGDPITLKSTSSGTEWYIDNDGDTEDLDFVRVQDSNNIAGPIKIITADDSINDGNNTNWTINLVEITWVGGTVGNETSWNTDTNWNLGFVPTAIYSVIIDSAAVYMPVIDVVSATVKNLTIESGATLDTGGNTLTINNSFENQGTLYRHGGDSVSRMDSDSGLVVYRTSGGSIQSDYSGNDDYRLLINGPSETFSLNSDLDVTDDLTIAGGTLSAGTYTITVGGNWSVASGASFNSGTGNVIFNGTTDQALESGGSSFNNLTKQGGSRLTVLTNSVNITGNLNISGASDIIDMGSLGFTLGALTNNGTLELDGNQSIQSITTMDTDSGMVIYKGSSGGTVRLTEFYNIKINRNARTFTLNSDIDVNGSLTIEAGTLKANNNTIMLAGNWANSGSFTPGTGTLVFDTTGTSVISGNTTFNNYTCLIPNKTIQFAEGSTQLVNGSFTVQGTSGNNITLESTSVGTQWMLNASGSVVSYVSVQDSDASGGNEIGAADSTNNGNNANWNFNPGVTIVSREVEDSDGNGQIDRIKLTAFEALNDNFTGLTASVGSFGGIGYTTGSTGNDAVFYITFTESGSYDTDDTPDVQITGNTTLKDSANLKLVVVDPAPVTPEDRASPLALSVTPTSLSESETGSVNVTITFSEAMDTGVNPSPTITGLSSGYTVIGSSWANGNTEWRGSFNFMDDNEEATGNYQMSGFTDASGNVMGADGSKTVTVDTLNPTLTVR
jgi:hypothetical protein